ncbi:hypothetical protein ITJ54_05320 [Curtobacterium sp. VKM Ac-2865]|uniref:hypothetical protein n=1 Tax=Curtobacterium sp. VKM Ac-2865 TaxID=2783817 RepID=UPI00188D9DCA|nr:hypothetical protein [Curtobacterium sp. VKM Ac-2865]MBF4582085.1 hypothetical protein [Curtobacterium sp. VKM Ac-2865]
MTDDVQTESDAMRTVIVAVLVVVATLALLTVGVATPTRPPVALIAGGVAVVTGGLSLVGARKRGNLLGWYAMTLGVMGLRALTGS